MAGIVVLKGAGTLVVAQDALPPICDRGNPGMASPGMGDVLTGVIAGIAAQTADLADAARAGVLVHAMAGDMAARRGERGLLATDLFRTCRRASTRCNDAEPRDCRARRGAPGARWARRCCDVGGGPCVIAIEGELGAGKTTFVGGVLAQFRHRRARCAVRRTR